MLPSTSHRLINKNRDHQTERTVHGAGALVCVFWSTCTWPSHAVSVYTAKFYLNNIFCKHWIRNSIPCIGCSRRSSSSPVCDVYSAHCTVCAHIMYVKLICPLPQNSFFFPISCGHLLRKKHLRVLERNNMRCVSIADCLSILLWALYARKVYSHDALWAPLQGSVR